MRKTGPDSTGGLSPGAHHLPDGRTAFKVWAPSCRKLELKLHGSETRPMTRDAVGYYSAVVDGLKDGARYSYVIDGEKERPDPASRFQPEGVHGPSAVVDPRVFRWSDGAWRGLRVKDAIFYEVHVGTFTPEGTFRGMLPKIAYLKQLGVTCLEIMPIAQFPGTRNWGYDGVGLYAVHSSYGTPDDFKALVDACHAEGIAVCLDVVYNHLGPEGNYLKDFGPYFTPKYKTPWGEALNYDDEHCLPVREFVAQNALYWTEEFHVDALRLDAIHGIFDASKIHILRELKEKVQRASERSSRNVLVVAESDLNDPKVVLETGRGGYGLDAQWSDDFHHAFHVVLTGERQGYYRDFSGLKDLTKALTETFVYDGRESGFRKRRHGVPAKDVPGERFVVFTQNHDQIGNRATGDRLSTMISFEAQKVSAALLLFSPYLPLLFMGQEFGETSPFQYFIDHGDPQLVEAVRNGRRSEFEAFGWKEVPDPKDKKTFLDSRINWNNSTRGSHALLFKLYRDLIALRKKTGIPEKAGKHRLEVVFNEKDAWLCLCYALGERAVPGLVVSFSGEAKEMKLPFQAAFFQETLCTESDRYGGSLKGGPQESEKTILLQPMSARWGTFRK